MLLIHIHHNKSSDVVRLAGALAFLSFLFLMSCGSGNRENINTPEEGFNLAGSDPAAVELADSIMAAMGGRARWNDTRFLSWNFSGRRNLVWDKRTGRVRIESPDEKTIYLVNVNTLQGRVQVKGKEIFGDSAQKLMQRARSIWINDSYWLIMPFKLKASGVTLRYLGEDTLMNGNTCNVMDLTFSDPKNLPNSKYRIFVDLRDNLVKQWSYYKNADQDSATFMRPWDSYKKYGEILLSADRSDNSGPKDVRVDTQLSDKVFTEF